MRLDFEHPQALVLLVPCILAVYVLWRASRTYMPPVRRGLALALRIVVVTLLVLTISSPRVQLPAQQLAVAIILDRSDSISPVAQAQEADWLARALAVKNAQDEVAVVSFGSDAMLERPLSPDSRPPRLAPAGVDGRRTDVAAGIRAGLASLPPGTARRLVLLSDGRENKEHADQAAALAAAAGVQLLAVPATADEGPEVLVRQLDAPSRLHEGDRFTVTAHVESTVWTSAVLRLLVDGILVASQDVDLQKGLNRFVLAQDSLMAGQHLVRLHVEPQLDTLPENNTAGAVIMVSGPPTVLVVEGTPGEGRFLSDALRASGLRVDLVGPLTAGLDRQGLRSYAAVALVNVSASALAAAQLRSLQAYVRDYGGGLVVVGGDSTYGPGGYARTPLEDMLPVRMDLRGKSVSASVALMLVMDVSGSMSGGPGGASKMDLAKEAAIAAVELLGDYDQVGILAFDDQNHWMIRPVFADDLTPIEQAINRLQPGGGTEIYPALKEAFAAIAPIDAKVKHMVLLTDGQAPRGEYPTLMQQMHDAKVTLSTIGIGSDADTPLLQELAQLGNGRYYDGNDPFDLPRLLVKETQQVQRAAIVEHDFSPIALAASPATEGIDFRSAPQLRGYVATTPKPQSSVLLASDQLDPILSEWHYGLGRVVTWASDARNRWSSRWLQWPDFSRFWAQVVKRAVRPPEDPNRQLNVVIEGDQARITLDAQTGDEPLQRRYVNFLPTTALVSDPRGQTQQIPMPQIAPGRYQAGVPVDDDGLYTLTVTQTNPDGTTTNQASGFVVPYSPEYRMLGTDTNMLERLAGQTGGRLITNPEQAFAHDLPSVSTPHALWPLLLIAAALLFVVDVAVRRVRFSAPELRAAYYGLRRRIGYIDVAPSLARNAAARLQRPDDAARGATGLAGSTTNRRATAVAAHNHGTPGRASRLLAAKQRAVRR